MTEKILATVPLVTTEQFVVYGVDIDFGNHKQARFEMMWFADNTWATTTPWVIIVAYNRDSDEIVLIEQFQVALWTRTLLLPRWGKIAGKTLLQTAQVEFLEETWYEAKSWHELPVVYSSPGYSTQCTQVFLAEWFQQAAHRKIGDEIELTTPVILPRSVVKQKVFSWEIVDARTISALYLLEMFISMS